MFVCTHQWENNYNPLLTLDVLGIQNPQTRVGIPGKSGGKSTYRVEVGFWGKRSRLFERSRISKFPRNQYRVNRRFVEDQGM